MPRKNDIYSGQRLVGYNRPRFQMSVTLPVESLPLAKAGFLRGYIDYLRTAGLMDAVRERVSPDTRALLDDPPLASHWCSVRHTHQIIEAVGALGGAAAVRSMARHGAHSSTWVVLRPVLQGMLRMFGGSPRSLISRADLALRNTSRGIRISYQERSATSCGMEYRSSSVRWTPMTAEAWAGGCESVLEFCGADGAVVVEEISDEGNDSVVRVGISWK
jgi:hypothetical protein